MVTRTSLAPSVLARAMGILCFALALQSSARAQSGHPTVEAELLHKIDSLSEIVVRPDERQALKSYYADRAYRPVWFDETGPTRAAASLIKEIGEAQSWGLKAADFPLTPVKQLTGTASANAGQVAAAEYELSAAILRYARQARGGRIPEPDRLLSDYLDRRPASVDTPRVLELVTAAAQPSDTLKAFHPKHAQFVKLHDLYVKLQGSGVPAAAPKFPAKGPMLVPGQSNPEIALLRQRLGVMRQTDLEELYDAKLVDAVRSFQTSASLDVDGIVGPVTRKALNAATGDTEKLQAIVATMEQWRWMPDDLGQSHLLINIPAFSVDFMRDGVSVLSERVIAGKPDKQTPLFSKNMTSIVLRPSWFLPDSIKLEKLLSAKRRGKSLEDEGIIVKKGNKVVDSSDVDWESADLRQYSIYQPSGDGNALGDVKFVFPNKHSVYLHDTPKKSLFEESERLFSHGCVRLRNPLAFAQRILDADKGVGAVKVSDLARKGPGSNEIVLAKPLPVHIGYFTVWIDGKGEASFMADPYGHDERITLALNGQWNAIEKHIEPQAPSVALAAAPAKQKQDKPVKLSAKSNDVSDSRPEPKRTKTFAPPQGLINSNATSGRVREKSKKGWVSGPARPSGYVGQLMHSAYIP